MKLTAQEEEGAQSATPENIKMIFSGFGQIKQNYRATYGNRAKKRARLMARARAR